MRRWWYEDAGHPWQADEILRYYLPDLPQRSRGRRDTQGRALDLGMGYGRNALWLAERGFEVEGWDVDGRYVQEARREMRERLTLWRGAQLSSIATRKSKTEKRKSEGTETEGREPLAETEEQIPPPPFLQKGRGRDDSSVARQGPGRLRARQGDFSRGDWRGPYDVIVINQALHQLKRSEALRVLRRAKRALRIGGRLFLLAKLTHDKHVRRVARSAEWEKVRGESNTWRRAAPRGRREFHPGRRRRRWRLLSALTAGEIRETLRGLRLVHFREVVLRSDWEEVETVTHTVAEVVGEKQ